MRSQLNGPNEWSVTLLCALASMVSLIHWSGVVLPCTTTRWKRSACAAGSVTPCFADISAHEVVAVVGPAGSLFVGPDSVTHAAPTVSGLSERYLCESPSNN